MPSGLIADHGSPAPCLLLIELQRAILQQDAVGAGAQIGSIGARTSAKVKAKAVSRADQVVSVKLAIRKGRAFVRAGVLEREQAATAPEDGKVEPIQFRALVATSTSNAMDRGDNLSRLSC